MTANTSRDSLLSLLTDPEALYVAAPRRPNVQAFGEIDRTANSWALPTLFEDRKANKNTAPGVRFARAAGASLLALTFAVSSTSAIAGRERHIAALVDADLDNGPTWLEPEFSEVADVEIGEQVFSFASAFSYHQLFHTLAVISDAADDYGIAFDPGAIVTAGLFLKKAEQLRWSAPSIDWHGNDAIVFAWARDSKIVFFTITEGMIGFFAETDGEIGKRHSSIPFDNQTDLLALSERVGMV